MIIKGSDLVVGSFDNPLFHFLLQPVSEDVRKTGTRQLGVFKYNGHSHAPSCVHMRHFGMSSLKELTFETQTMNDRYFCYMPMQIL